jgi:hypothetical protein
MLGIGMNARKLGAICALLAATLNLIGCESSRDSPDRMRESSGPSAPGVVAQPVPDVPEVVGLRPEGQP